jgi:ubiquinone/menaquinone biosynthesis C-methylase UbiE
MASNADKAPDTVDFYDTTYGSFDREVYAQIRSEAFGDDIGQNSWLTADEQDRFSAWLQLGPGKTLLDVACGSGGTTLRLAQQTGCAVVGIDIHADAIERARNHCQRIGASGPATFEVVDASGGLPFPKDAFDAITCIDAINHLPDRRQALREWARVLKPGGRLLFSDPIIVTGALTSEEMRVRSSIGFFVFVPAGYDEQVIAASALRLIQREDVTENVARVAGRWAEARRRREQELQPVEGSETYEGQQRFLTMTRDLAASRRLSRYVFLAEK